MTRIVDIADTYISATTPTVEGSTAASLENFANNAAYESKYGAGAAGDTFWDTTLKVQKVHDGTAWRSTERALDNATASDPTVSDDTTQGYEVLSLWLNTSSGAFFRATDVTTGAAVWQEIAADSLLDSHIAATTAHGISGSVVGTTDAQVLTNKDIDGGTASNTSRITVPKAAKATLDGLTRKEGTIVYASDTNTLYADDGTTLQEIGSGGGGLDVFHTDDFELANAFVTGNNATPDAAGTGTLDGTVSDETSAPISDAQSLKYVMGSTSTNDFFINGSDIALDEKQTNNWVGANFWYTYNGDDDDIRFFILDQDDAELTTSIEYIKSNTTATRFSTAVYIPDGTTGIRYGFQVVTGNSAKIFITDDLELSTNPFVYKNLITQHSFELRGGNGVGATSTKIRRFDNKINEVGSGLLSYSDDSNLGGIVTALKDCVVSVEISGKTTGANNVYNSIGKNLSGADLTASAGSITATKVYGRHDFLGSGGSDSGNSGSATIPLSAGDTIMLHKDGTDANDDYIVATFSATTTTEHVVTPAKSTLTNLEDYTPTTQGFGTPTITYSKWRQFGDCVHGVMKITLGTRTASEIQIGLPSGYTVHSDYSLTEVGRMDVGNATDSHYSMLATGGDTYLNIGFRNASVNNLFTAQNGTSILSDGDVVSIEFMVKVNELTSNATFLAAVPTQLVAYIKDVKSSGTNGGTFTSGAWQTRDLNDLSGDTSFLSLASNQFTLSSGKYIIEASAPADQVNSHKAMLYNITDSSNEIIGTTARCGTAQSTNNRSYITGTVEISSSKTFEIQDYCQTTRATDGFGVSFGNPSVDEVYTQVKITKLK